MANRVLLSVDGLKISKPGVNVLTASAANLNFNSDWSSLGTIGEGLYSRSFSTISGSGNELLPFERSVSGEIIVIYEYVLDGQYYMFGGSNRFLVTRTAHLREGSVSWGSARYSISARAESSGLRVTYEWDRVYPQIVIPDFTFRWKAFHYNF